MCSSELQKKTKHNGKHKVYFVYFAKLKFKVVKTVREEKASNQGTMRIPTH